MKSFVILFCIFAIHFIYVEAHGRLLDPPGRSTRWRTNSSAPANYDDHGLYCGGFGTQWGSHGGKCGICGDNYGITPPRPNELGGRYGEGVIVKRYNGRTADVTVEITANHLGYIFFELCPNLDKESETEECYANNRLRFSDGSIKREIGRTTGKITTTLVWPEDLNSEHSSLRWTYYTGNNWGVCEDGRGAMGCGAQETFKSCADISIYSSGSKALSADEPVAPIDV